MSVPNQWSRRREEEQLCPIIFGFNLINEAEKNAFSLGDVIEVVGSSDTGLLEGTLRGATGLFSRDVVQVCQIPPHAPHLQQRPRGDIQRDDKSRDWCGEKSWFSSESDQ